MPIQADFPLARYEDGILTTYMSPPQSVDGWDIRFTVKRRFGGSTTLISKSCASGFNGVSGINVTNATQGIFEISVNEVDTSGFEFQNYAASIERRNSGFSTVLQEGYIIVLPSMRE